MAGQAGKVSLEICCKSSANPLKIFSGYDATPFIRYMLKVILACYMEFEERVGLVGKVGVRSSAYDVVKTYVSGKVGKFTSAEVIASCPSFGRSAVMAAIKRLVEEKEIIKIGTGRATCYVRTDSSDEDYFIQPN